MCPPTHFGVDYVINPWMAGNVAAVDQAQATAEWQALHAVLAARAEVTVVDAANGLPDMVFTANAGLVDGAVFVPSRFRHAERQGEEAHFSAWARGAGFDLRALPDGITFEGAGDALFDRGTRRLWLGHGHRTDAGAAAQISRILDMEVLPLRLVDPQFYHLDTCFCPLDGGALLYYPPAFDAEAQALIAARVPAGLRLATNGTDALAFACNAVNLGRDVVLNRASDALRAELQDAGFDTIESPTGEFMKAGGSVKCLTLRLDEPG